MSDKQCFCFALDTATAHLSLLSKLPAVQAGSSQAGWPDYLLAASPEGVLMPSEGRHVEARLDHAANGQEPSGTGLCWWGHPAPLQRGQKMSQTGDCPVDADQACAPVHTQA